MKQLQVRPRILSCCHATGIVGYSCYHPTGAIHSTRLMPIDSKSEILQGTLDLMVLKTLAAMGSLHGYGIARRIEQISEEALQINQGTIYASLVRLLHKGWI